MVMADSYQKFISSFTHLDRMCQSCEDARPSLFIPRPSGIDTLL